MKWLDKIKLDRKANYHDTAGIRLARAGELTQAIDEFRQALEYRRDDGVIRYNLGLALLNSGKTEEALSEFKLAIRFEPTYSDVYLALATCYAILGPDWKSFVCYQAYLDLVPEGEKSDVARMRLREKSTSYKEFNEREWLQVIRRAYDERVKGSGMDGARLGSHFAKKQAQNPTETRKIISGMSDYWMSAMQAKSEEWALAHFLASTVLWKRKKYRATILQVIEGLEIFPFIQGAILLLTFCYTRVGEYERAARLITVIDREKLNPEELVMLGKLLSGLKEGGYL